MDVEKSLKWWGRRDLIGLNITRSYLTCGSLWQSKSWKQAVRTGSSEKLADCFLEVVVNELAELMKLRDDYDGKTNTC